MNSTSDLLWSELLPPGVEALKYLVHTAFIFRRLVLFEYDGVQDSVI
jgi:hypothetical protein